MRLVRLHRVLRLARSHVLYRPPKIRQVGHWSRRLAS